jgi:AcrR family transcriptional regulator
LAQTALLRAARRAFAKVGYERASLDAIATAAGMTKGSIYHHYSDKRELFRAVFEDVERQMVEQIDQAAAGGQTSVDRILLGCDAFFDIVLTTGVVRIVLTDAPAVLGWATWRAVDNETGGRSLRAGLCAGMKAGEIARLDLDMLTTLISGALTEAALTIAESADPKRARREAKKTLRRLLEGLAPLR